MGSRLDTATSANANNPSYAVSAGTNRALIVGITQEVASPSQPTVTYGTVSMTFIGGIAVGDATDQRVDMYYLNDAGIDSASGTTVAVTGLPTAFTIHMASYENVQQTVPSGAGNVDTHAATGAGTSVLSLTSQDDSVAVVVAGMGDSGTIAWSGGVTEQTEQVDAGATATGSLADEEVATGASETYTGTWTTANRRAGVGCVLQNVAAEGIISIDSDYGDAADEFDFDENSLDLNGLNFGASQGGGTVYISDAATLAGSADEVDITAAVNTWSDVLVNLDLTGLSTEVADLHTLGPGARFVIVLTDASDEYSLPVAMHRPKAFSMSDSAFLGAGGFATTARLTAPAGKGGDFTTGRGADDENPLDAIDIAADFYSEFLWSLEALSAAPEGYVYEFRVLADGLPLESYTATPQWTIGAPVAGDKTRPSMLIQQHGSFIMNKRESGRL